MATRKEAQAGAEHLRTVAIRGMFGGTAARLLAPASRALACARTLLLLLPVLLLSLLAAPRAAAQSNPPAPPLKITLEEALERAQAHNASLPLAADRREIARQGVRAARARFYPGLSLDGDVHDGSPSHYASGDARAQVVVTDTLYAGGALRSGLRTAEAQYRSADAAYRVSRREVDLAVRTLFTEALRYEREVVARSEGIVRLRGYLIWLQSRQAAGQGVAADVLSARTREGAEEANIAEAELSFDEARLELNELMGLDPRAEVELVPLPEPTPPAPAEDEPWLRTPDVEQAGFDSIAAHEIIASTRAERRPLVWASANAGWEPTFGPQGAPLNTGEGKGIEAVVGITLPFFDFGGYDARMEQARLLAREASDSLRAAKRQTRLAWARAAADVQDLYRIYRLRADAVPIARDSYLGAESTYRGGAGTALEVLDAYSAWIETEVAEADAAMRLRQAEAAEIRWGTP